MKYQRPSLGFRSTMTLYATCLICLAASPSQNSIEPVPTVLKTESTFVWVPALVKSRDQFESNGVDLAELLLLDNGAAQHFEKVETDGLPISLVILMQTGGAAAQFLNAYEALPELIAGVVGNSVHEITLATFDSRVEQIWHFPVRSDGLDYALRNQRAGDKGAAIKDAVAFAVRQLQGEPGKFRRVILLLSQPNDEGSSIAPSELIRQIGTSSTVIYSLTFPKGKAHTATSSKRRIGNSIDAAGNVVLLLGNQTAEELSFLTGGNNSQFIDGPSFNSAMLEIASEFRHSITLGFQPSCCETGFHRITVRTKSPKQQVTARGFYWRLPPD